MDEFPLPLPLVTRSDKLASYLQGSGSEESALLVARHAYTLYVEKGVPQANAKSISEELKKRCAEVPDFDKVWNYVSKQNVDPSHPNVRDFNNDRSLIKLLHRRVGIDTTVF